jgi:UrcA family protein
MLTTLKLTALSAALAVGFAAYAPSAAAQDVEGLSVYGQSAVAPNAEIVSVAVPYGDLNLSSEAGAQIMLQRIHNAAVTICGTESGSILDRVMVYEPCADGITYRAVARFDNPIVSALNDRRMGRGTYLASNGYGYYSHYPD